MEVVSHSLPSFKKLTLFSHQLNSKNNGQLMLFKNILLFGH